MPAQIIKHHSSGTNRPIRYVILSLIGSLILIVLLFLSASIILRQEWSGIVMKIFAFVCCALPALLCGFLGAKSASHLKAVFGILTALPILLVTAILCFALFGKIGSGFAAACLVVLVSAVVGAGCSMRRKSRKRKYR